MRLSHPEMPPLLDKLADVVRYVKKMPATENASALPGLMEKLPCHGDRPALSGRECSGACLVFDARVPALPPDVAPCPCRHFLKSISPLFGTLLKIFDCEAALAQVPVCGKATLAWTEADDQTVLEARLLAMLAEHVDRVDRVDRVAHVDHPARVSARGFYPESWKSHCTSRQALTLERLERLMHLHDLFYSARHAVITWRMVRSLYVTLPGEARVDAAVESRDALRGLLARVGTVVLYWDAKPLVIKAGTNPEIGGFEEFIADIEATECALVVFSSQALCPLQGCAAAAPARPDFRVDVRSTYRDSDNRLRFTSVKAKAKAAPTLQDCLRQGSFDRLIEALARGQSWLEDARPRG